MKAVAAQLCTKREPSINSPPWRGVVTTLSNKQGSSLLVGDNVIQPQSVVFLNGNYFVFRHNTVLSYWPDAMTDRHIQHFVFWRDVKNLVTSVALRWRKVDLMSQYITPGTRFSTSCHISQHGAPDCQNNITVTRNQSLDVTSGNTAPPGDSV